MRPPRRCGSGSSRLSWCIRRGRRFRHPRPGKIEVFEIDEPTERKESLIGDALAKPQPQHTQLLAVSQVDQPGVRDRCSIQREMLQPWQFPQMSHPDVGHLRTAIEV